MALNNNQKKALAGVILFHGLIVAVLLLSSLTTPLPLPEEQGVEVNLGYSDDGMGDIQPEEPSAMEQSSPSSSSSDDGILTDDNAETPAIDKDKRNEPKNNNNQSNDKEVEEEKPVVDRRALYPGNQKKTSNGGNEGETGRPGDQGNPYGNPDAKNHTGNPGTGGGDGISYKLSGRSSKHLPKPMYNSAEQGKVVVTITVDREGNVIKANPGAKGTTTSSQQLWKLAKQAALKAKFDINPGAPAEQKGSITYNFIRLN